MRKSILVLAVLYLTLFSNAFGQATETTRSQIDNRVDNDFECTSAMTDISAVDRIRNARRCYEHGLRLTERGLLPQAAESLRRALQLDPEFVDGYSALGRTYFKLREWQKAIDNFNRAASLSSKLRETNEAVIKKHELEEQQKISLSPKASLVAGLSNSPNSNQRPTQMKAVATISVQPNQLQTAKVQNKPVQPNTRAPVQAKPAQVTNRESAAKVNPAPVSIGQNNVETTEVKESSAQEPAPPAKETQSALNFRKDESSQQNGSTGAPNLERLKEAEPQNVAATSASSKDSEVSLSEQSAIGTRVAMNATPASSVKEAGSPVVSTLPSTEELRLTKIYRVGPNDVLDVRLNTSGQESTLYTVTPTGLLEHPLLTEPMPVAGLTVEEIASKFEEDLRKRAIIEDPKANIGVRDYASHALLVSGHVKEGGTKYLRREAIPLYVVVADAQPLPEAAKVTVVRNDLQQIFEIDLNQATEMNFLVRSGDVITLSPNTTEFIYIGGEIKFPGEKTFRRGLTLMQTVLAAGGLGPKAKVAEIARDEGKGFLIATRFKLNDIVSGKAIDPLLKPGDRISILR